MDRGAEVNKASDEGALTRDLRANFDIALKDCWDPKASLEDRAQWAERRHMFWRTRCLEHARTIDTQQKLLHALWSCLERIIDEPNNTMSDGKALKEIIRLAKAGLHETRY